MKEAIEEFRKYTDLYLNYGINIERKINHTFRVVSLCEEIAKSLNLPEEDIELAKLGGLLHDIGRFEQYKNYQTFKDSASIDHGLLGYNILTPSFIRKFNSNKENDALLRKVVLNHNKYSIDKYLTEKEKLICNIVRDADKIDILYLVLNSDILPLDNSTVSEEVYEEILNKKLVTKEKRQTQADNLVCNLAFIFDISFSKSLEIILKKDYLNKLITKYLATSNQDFKEKLLVIKDVLNKCLEGDY